MSQEILSLTAPKLKEVCLTWKIERFSEIHCGPGIAMAGPMFSLPTMPASSWQSFIDTYKNRRKENFLYYRAQLLDSACAARINYKLSIIAGDQSKAETKSKAFMIGKSKRKYIHVYLGYLHNIKERNQLHNDVLLLECRFNVVLCNTRKNVVAKVLTVEGLKYFSDNFESLYFSKRFSDFTIIVGSEKFFVHKCILAARSPVFAAMLRNDTLEALNNQLEITDLHAKTVEAMILYLYTGRLEDISCDIYLELYSAADKYLLKSLRKVCVFKLIKMIRFQNALDIYVVSYYHNDNILKAAAEKYILKHFKAVRRSKKWKKMEVENNRLAADLLMNAGSS